MSLVCISGELGEGKTLAMTYLGLYNYVNKNKNLFSNYKLFHVPYTHIDSIEAFDNIRSGLCLMDELWYWIDCRSSLSKTNKILRDIIMKSRKRDYHIFYTSQRFGQVDIAVRSVTDFI